MLLKNYGSVFGFDGRWLNKRSMPGLN